MSEPLYARTAQAIRALIAEKAWKDGDRLPSEPQLCLDFGVSSITMRRAIATLVTEGLLVRLQGKGTFVTSDHAMVQGPPHLTSFSEDMRFRGWKSTARVISLQTEQGSLSVCTKLGLPKAARIIRLRRLRLADGKPIAVQDAYLPALTFPDLESHNFARESLYDVLGRVYGAKPSTATEVVRVDKLSAEEAKWLEAKPGSPAFKVERITRDSSGRTIELVQSALRSDRYFVVLQLSAGRPVK